MDLLIFVMGMGRAAACGGRRLSLGRMIRKEKGERNPGVAYKMGAGWLFHFLQLFETILVHTFNRPNV